MARTASSFGRRPARFKPQPRTLVLCEDSKSCLVYLQDAAKHFRSFALVRIAHPGRTDPRGIVRAGIDSRSQYERVYCVLDRDGHPDFAAALNDAQQGGIHVIASYPCYEFWLLLHFRETRAPITSVGELSAGARTVRALQQEDGMAEYSKSGAGGVWAALLARYGDARERACRVLAAAMAEDELNPSTTLHLLLERLEALGKLETIE